MEAYEIPIGEIEDKTLLELILQLEHQQHTTEGEIATVVQGDTGTVLYEEGGLALK